MLRRIAFCSILLLMLTACTAGRVPIRKEQPKAPEIITLKVAHCQAQDEEQALDALIAAYQERQPDTRVEKTPVDCGPEGLQKLPTLTEYDVLPVNFWGRGGREFVDLLPYMAANSVSTEPFGHLLEERKVDGRVLGLPVRVAPHLLWANKSFFEQAGLPLPTGGWTWEEFRAVSARLGAQRTDGSRVALQFEVPEWLLRYWLEERTDRPAHQADVDLVRAALTYFQTLVLTDRTLSMPEPIDPNMTRFGDTAAFREGKVPLAYDGLPSIQEVMGKLSTADVELLPMPTHAGTRPVTLGWKYFYGISAHSAQPDAAFAFLKFATGPDGAGALARAGYFPAVPTDGVSQIWANWSPPLPPAIQSLVKTRMAADYQDKEWQSDRALREAANHVMRGELSVEDAVNVFNRDLLTIARGR